jgi:hypothetical protein
MSLATLTAEDFEAHIGSEFSFRVDSGTEAPAALRLVSVKRVGVVSDGRRQPFSLLFEEDRDIPLPQSIYPLVHDGLGDLDIFIVPLSLSGGRCTYEAVFT